ncbi:PEP/pyruvate-binding domain-containing protein [Aristaeella hokkaidonensis]|uniref:Phosphoenolpyruvate synthase n=1 Tax=Aristaeella hokkaidonensis TaxID=3046382 RepID=A0AC61N7W8_9FIRM|nr:PEP/pyruvate-binding domain-containing protein [Aristaeella hokkaidonensis]QUC67639.1 phosphoenolpyruvate synthase [Aristaeella hokkaidonensis]SNT92685.1 Pyruvate phosphate dikinase, PEP/pyruvate binding domain [Aristaeella hokkaidonensis]
MAAFDRVLSGIPALDQVLDNIRMGDNVVWRVSDLDEFRRFADPFVEQAKKDGRNIIYFRFASHPELVPECPEVKRICVPLSHRFETFTVEIHKAIEQEGRDAFYVFDCLSELQTAWATDLMMGNFFRVTCPFLFILDTVAFFPIIRGRHSFNAITKIMNTTQLFLDVYSDAGRETVYIRPQKVWNRSSETMFLPHLYKPTEGTIRPIQDGVQTSRFYQVMNSYQRTLEEQYVDSWDRFFTQAKVLHENRIPVEEQCGRMCNIMMTRDERLRVLVKKHFKPEDYFRVRDHMVGTGMVGGKTCGMLLARAIIRNLAPDIDSVLEPHDSFYVGSDVFYTYIVDNDFWDIRVRQRTEEGYFPLAGELAERLRTGHFSREIQEQFTHILEYYGQDPYIVRSSSILEDGFDNAFAGKYESVFCANRGTPEERLEEFENAVRTVYASSASLSALDYRKRRGLDKRDEQMALLVMRVSGSAYGSYYMPCAAGVGYSFSPYKFLNDIDSSAGMLRLVAGLGTSAVDRTEGSYPRLVSLDKPEVTNFTTVAEKHQFSQRKAEVVDLKTRSLNRVPLDDLEPVLPAYVKNQVLEHDTEAEASLHERGVWRNICFISCLGLVRNREMMEKMQRMMQLIQKEYGEPVDIEFTINVSESREYMINLLQCRPLQVFKDGGGVAVPENVPAEDILLETRHASMGLSRQVKVDRIVYVDPVKYYQLPYNEKTAIAALIGRINWKYRDTGMHLMLLVPGRIGTSSPELGVPTAFSDISGFDAVCEIAESRTGYNPELSYGSHIFQDLVEAQILYTAVFPGERTIHFRPELLRQVPNRIGEIPGGEEKQDVVCLADVSALDCRLYHDLTNEHILLKF